MKKSEQVSMAIGKCFAKSRLNETDIATIKELGASGLLDEGLNENQIREIMLIQKPVHAGFPFGFTLLMAICLSMTCLLLSLFFVTALFCAE